MAAVKVDLPDLVRAGWADAHNLITPQARERMLSQTHTLEDLALSLRAILLDGAIQQGEKFISDINGDMDYWRECKRFIQEFAETNEIELIP